MNDVAVRRFGGRRLCRDPTKGEFNGAMSTIHFVEKETRFERVPQTKDEWESGYWRLSPAAAESLVGADVYFHAAKSARSHFGGKVLGSRVQVGGDFAGLTVLHFRYTKDHRGVSGGDGKWGVERKSAAAPVAEPEGAATTAPPLS
jgi:hypothetical protein